MISIIGPLRDDAVKLMPKRCMRLRDEARTSHQLVQGAAAHLKKCSTTEVFASSVCFCKVTLIL